MSEETEEVVEQKFIQMPNGDILPYTDENWAASFPSEEEIASQQNRAWRDSLLVETDAFALSDRNISDAMVAYRAALRDITTHANWPVLNDEDWPTKPEE